MSARFFKWVCRFRRNDDGIAALEFAIICPGLVVLLFGAVTLFHGFSESIAVEKATYTVADIVSRQTTVAKESLQTMTALFTKMMPATNSLVKFRISSIKRANNVLSVDWSYAEAPTPKLTTADIPRDALPIIQEGDSIILVETSVAFKPLMESVGLTAGTHDQIAANRPRFTSAIIKTDEK